MELHIDKDKLWKGVSYVLKTSRLQQAIAERGLDCYVHLVYWAQMGSMIEAEFWEPTPHVPQDRFYIRTGIVQSRERKAAEKALVEEVLPKLLDWMVWKKGLPINSTARRGGFWVYYREGKVVYGGRAF